MTDPIKPNDFVYEDIPVTNKEAFSAAAETRVRQTIKAALQSYIDQYMNSKGRFHTQLKQTAPFGGNYVTDCSRDPYNDDPLQYNVLLSRIWKQLQAKLPAIIISDTGMTPEASGLGNQDSGYRIDAWNQTLETTVLGTMSVEILAAAMSESEASDLGDVLNYILGPLTAINKGYWIHSQRASDQWEVRLPQVPPVQTGVERRPMGDDTVDVMWTVTLSFDVEFEGHVYIGIATELNAAQNENIFPSTTRAGMGFLSDSVDASVYKVPATVRLGVPTPIVYHVLPYGAVLTSDNPAIAVVDENNVIRPRAVGTFNVLLLGKNPGQKNGEVLARHTVEVKIT